MVKLVYWSGSGNTAAMAAFIEQGLKESGKEVESGRVEGTKLEDIHKCDTLILGCPSMGSEELEETEMEPFVESLANEVSGKKVALFGSYGWGDGEWMENWKERMLGYGANIIVEPLIVNEAPEGEDEIKCIEYGKDIAKNI